MPKIIADISGNHGGSLDKAMDLIRAAADCGCDYAKFQYYDASIMPDQENRALYDKLEIPYDWLYSLFQRAEEVGIPLFASVFDVGGVLELEDWELPYYKIASPESTRLSNYSEIVGAIRRGIPIIFSTGKRDLLETVCLSSERDILLYCPEGHPPPRFNLEDLDFYERNCFDGLSDHCANLSNAKIFIDLGAEWVERHLKLDDDCVDAAFSSDPKEMTKLCKLAHE